MKKERNIWIAFFLNLGFSLFELFGGLYTGSIAILSDAFHDGMDAVSIGISCALERKSKKEADPHHTYGYVRYSVLGGLITTVLLLIGSLFMIYNAVGRLFAPEPIRYDGVLLLAVSGLCINLGAALLTRDGESLNQRAVNLHMLEDVLGWAVVLVGAVAMKRWDLSWLDPVLSIGVSGFVLIKAIGNLKQIGDLFLLKTPEGWIRRDQKPAGTAPGILEIHHIHLWSMDGMAVCGSMHVITEGIPEVVKKLLREALLEMGIAHVTLELETREEVCRDEKCRIESHDCHCGHHH